MNNFYSSLFSVIVCFWCLESVTDLLVVILDLNPAWWADQLETRLENGTSIAHQVRKSIMLNSPIFSLFRMIPFFKKFLVFHGTVPRSDYDILEFLPSCPSREQSRRAWLHPVSQVCLWNDSTIDCLIDGYFDWVLAHLIDCLIDCLMDGCFDWVLAHSIDWLIDWDVFTIFSRWTKVRNAPLRPLQKTFQMRLNVYEIRNNYSWMCEFDRKKPWEFFGKNFAFEKHRKTGYIWNAC